MLGLNVMIHNHILLLGHVKIKLMSRLMPLVKLELESEYEQEHAAMHKLKGKSTSLSLSFKKGLNQCIIGR